MTVMHSEGGGVTVWFLKDYFRLHVLHDVKDDCKWCICKDVTHIARHLELNKNTPTFQKT